MKFKCKIVVLLLIAFAIVFFFSENYETLHTQKYIPISPSLKAINNNYQLFRELQAKKQSTFESTQVKSILVINGHQRKEIEVFGFKNSSFLKQECQYHQCQLIFETTSIKDLDHFDAVLININDQFTLDGALPKRTRLDQRFIFFTQEPPPSLQKFYNISLFNGYFNWTMTYLSNSDIRFPYGQVLKANSKRNNALVENIIRHKKRSVAWMVSHCDTHGKREYYVEELSMYIDVDVFGICGDLTCPTGTLFMHDSKCFDMIEANYMFYLSFENSICHDYVTEKFFETLSHYIVPVVYGGADYSTIAPPNSYIDARNFSDPQDLALYLKFLRKNEDLYKKYFYWKETYTVKAGVEHQARHGFCELCRKLHQDHDIHWHDNLSADWDVEAQCISPPYDVR